MRFYKLTFHKIFCPKKKTFSPESLPKFYQIVFNSVTNGTKQWKDNFYVGKIDGGGGGMAPLTPPPPPRHMPVYGVNNQNVDLAMSSPH